MYGALKKLLSDASADNPDNTQEQRRLEETLRRAITEAKQTGDFEKALRHVLPQEHPDDPDEAEVRWRSTMHALNDYRRVEDVFQDQHIVAGCLLADLPHRFG